MESRLYLVKEPGKIPVKCIEQFYRSVGEPMDFFQCKLFSIKAAQQATATFSP